MTTTTTAPTTAAVKSAIPTILSCTAAAAPTATEYHRFARLAQCRPQAIRSRCRWAGPQRLDPLGFAQGVKNLSRFCFHGIDQRSGRGII